MRLLLTLPLLGLWTAGAETKCPPPEKLAALAQRIRIDARNGIIDAKDNLDGCKEIEVVVYNK